MQWDGTAAFIIDPEERFSAPPYILTPFGSGTFFKKIFVVVYCVPKPEKWNTQNNQTPSQTLTVIAVVEAYRRVYLPQAAAACRLLTTVSRTGAHAGGGCLCVVCMRYGTRVGGSAAGLAKRAQPGTDPFPRVCIGGLTLKSSSSAACTIRCRHAGIFIFRWICLGEPYHGAYAHKNDPIVQDRFQGKLGVVFISGSGEHVTLQKMEEAFVGFRCPKSPLEGRCSLFFSSTA